MMQQTHRGTETADAGGQPSRDRPVEDSENKALSEISAILIDATVHVGALIDAVCCRIGEWVDWQRYLTHPGTSADSKVDRGSIIRLAVANGDRGLPPGGYIEVRVLPVERRVEADGGYYDEDCRPHRIARSSLLWDEVDYESLGQALLLIHNSIIRAGVSRERPDDARCLKGLGAGYTATGSQ